jgi:hypothetical protein
MAKALSHASAERWTTSIRRTLPCVMPVLKSHQPLLKIAALAAGTLLPLLDASAQKMSAGIVVGRSLTAGFHDSTSFSFLPPQQPGAPAREFGTRFWSPSRDYVVGGTLEVRFNPRWSLQANGLFRQLNGKVAHFWRDEASPVDGAPNPVVTWQFPVLAKYRFLGRKINPFVAAGPSFRTSGNLNANNPSPYGITADVGFEATWQGLEIAPAVRLTRWAADNRPGGSQTRRDQVEVLVGFSRASEEDWRPFGRDVSLGFTLGVGVNGDYRTTRTVHELPLYPGASYVETTFGARSLIYGPTLEFRLTRRFAVEVGALNRPIGRTQEVAPLDGGRPVRWTVRNVTWVFPVLARYRFPVRGPTPFIALGPSFRMLRGAIGDYSSPYGIAATVGLEKRFGPMRLAPAIRVVHWAPGRLVDSDLRRNQVDALMGFSF